MRPDLTAKGFSAVNAFFFAGMSKIAYATKDEARGLLVGNSTNHGLGFNRFYWFEVQGLSQPRHSKSENSVLPQM